MEKGTMTMCSALRCCDMLLTACGTQTNLGKLNEITQCEYKQTNNQCLGSGGTIVRNACNEAWGHKDMDSKHLPGDMFSEQMAPSLF